MVKRRMTPGESGAGGATRKADAAKARDAAKTHPGKSQSGPSKALAGQFGKDDAAKPASVQASLNQGVSQPALTASPAKAASIKAASAKTDIAKADPTKPAPAKVPTKPVAATSPVPIKASPKPPEAKAAEPAPKTAELPKTAEVSEGETAKAAVEKPVAAKTSGLEVSEPKAPAIETAARSADAKVPEPKPAETKPEPITQAEPPTAPPSPPKAAIPEPVKAAEVKPAEAKAETLVEAPKPMAPAAKPPVAANSDLPALRAKDGTRLRLATHPLDIGEIGDTVVGYLRSEGAAALAHLKALGTAKSPADMIRLQVGEMQRVADASLTVWSDIARKASRVVELRRH